MAVRVGVIGVGSIGTAHATSLAREISGATVSVVHDFDAARASALAADLGARSAAAPAEVFGADDVDAVLIASPDAVHAEQVLLGLEAGKPVLCEKPLATSEQDAEAVLDAEVALGRRLIQVGFMRRFDPGYEQLKQEFTDDRIGAPLIVHNIHRNTRAPYGPVTEQTMTNMVIHEFDINRWLLDEDYASVMVLAGKPGPLTPAGERDPLLVVLQSASGVIVEIEAFANGQFGYEVVCRVTGSHGQAVLGDGAFVTRSRSFSRGVDIPELWFGRFVEAYRRQLQGWVDALCGGGPLPGASAWDGYVATVAANRAVQAYRDRRAGSHRSAGHARALRSLIRTERGMAAGRVQRPLTGRPSPSSSRRADGGGAVLARVTSRGGRRCCSGGRPGLLIRSSMQRAARAPMPWLSGLTDVRETCRMAATKVSS
jgi:myo-inositol 2-dehydrogenase/D-chiro-inositol 1-dehydrogenase